MNGWLNGCSNDGQDYITAGFSFGLWGFIY